MHAYLIYNLQFTISNSPDTLIITPEKSIGIDEVRQIQVFLSRKPMQSAKNMVYLKDAHLMTVFAQNALLKILEEPPGNSEIYLVTDQPDMLLPTVLSRCQFPNSPNSPNSQTASINPDGYNMDSISTREQALEFLDGVEAYLHSNLLTSINYQLITNCRKYLKANVNLKLCLDYLAINLLSY